VDLFLHSPGWLHNVCRDNLMFTYTHWIQVLTSVPLIPFSQNFQVHVWNSIRSLLASFLATSSLYKKYRQPIRCNSNGLLIIPISSTCFGRNHCPKHVELIGIINKPLLLHLVGCLYYLYQWCMVKKISNFSLSWTDFSTTTFYSTLQICSIFF